MRLQSITTSYPATIRDFYTRQGHLAKQSYAIQHAAFIANRTDWSDSWSVELNKLGYETDEILANVEPLQKNWASENELTFDEDNWLLDISTAQIKSFQPDVLFVWDYVTFTASYLNWLRSECPSIRLVIGWCGAPYKDESVFKAYDMVLSSVPELIKTFLANGHTCYQVNHAFDPRVLSEIDTSSPPNVDFSFIGYIAKGAGFHARREKLLLDLIEKTNLQIWTDVYNPSFSMRTSNSARRLAYDSFHLGRRMGVPESLLTMVPIVGKVKTWETKPTLPQRLDDRLISRCHPPVFGLNMFQQLQRSKVSLNVHIDISSTHASNMRLYEATGAGTCLLTDYKPNLRELFEPDFEIVSYESPEECIEKSKYLIDHEEERKAIAAAGQARTLREHTFEKRAKRLDELIVKML